MKLIMENWSQFINENKCPESSFYGRNYDKRPVTDPEMELLSRDDDCGANARSEMLAHIADKGELPDLSPRVVNKIGLLAKSGDDKNFNIFNHLFKRKRSKTSGQPGTSAEEEEGKPSVPIQTEEELPYRISPSAKRGSKIVIMNWTNIPARLLINGEPLRRILGHKKVDGAVPYSRWQKNPDGSYPPEAEERPTDDRFEDYLEIGVVANSPIIAGPQPPSGPWRPPSERYKFWSGPNNEYVRSDRLGFFVPDHQISDEDGYYRVEIEYFSLPNIVRFPSSRDSERVEDYKIEPIGRLNVDVDLSQEFIAIGFANEPPGSMNWQYRTMRPEQAQEIIVRGKFDVPSL